MDNIEQLIVDAIPLTLIGAALGGFASVAKSMAAPSQPDRVLRRLAFKPEAFRMDLGCATLFLELQQYRRLSPKHFDEAGLEADSVFCLEEQLLRNEVQPRNLDDQAQLARTAWRYSFQVSNRLQLFLTTAKATLYDQPALVLCQMEQDAGIESPAATATQPPAAGSGPAANGSDGLASAATGANPGNPGNPGNQGAPQFAPLPATLDPATRQRIERKRREVEQSKAILRKIYDLIADIKPAVASHARRIEGLLKTKLTQRAMHNRLNRL